MEHFKTQRQLIIISFTEEGTRQNAGLGIQLNNMGYHCVGYAPERFAKKFGLLVTEKDLNSMIGSRWGDASFLYIGAIGIAIRHTAPWLQDKYTDSAVIGMDEKGEFVIPLISGHVGGAVEIAKDVAECIGGTLVVTTATDVRKKFAVDVFTRKNDLVFAQPTEGREQAKYISANILEGEKVGFYCEYPICSVIPEEISLCEEVEQLSAYSYGIAVTKHNRNDLKGSPGVLRLLKKDIILGIGCRRGVNQKQLERQIRTVLFKHHIDWKQVSLLASIDLKRDEEGIRKLSQAKQIPFAVYTAEELNTVETVSSGSAFVEQTAGVDNVCERAALYAGREGELIQPKLCLDGVTVAMMRKRQVIDFGT